MLIVVFLPARLSRTVDLLLIVVFDTSFCRGIKPSANLRFQTFGFKPSVNNHGEFVVVVVVVKTHPSAWCVL